MPAVTHTKPGGPVLWGLVLLATAAACRSSGSSPGGGGPGGPAVVTGWFGPVGARPTGGSLRRRYELALDAELGAGRIPADPDQAVGGRPSVIKLRGQWTLTLLERHADGAVVRAEIDPRELEIAAPESAIVSKADYIERVRDELKRPLLVKQDARGAVVGVKPDPGLSAPASAIVRSIAALAQVQIPAGAKSGPAWTADEHDTTGRYQAQYQTAGERALRKKKLRYLEVDSTDGSSLPQPGELEIVGFTGELALSAAGALESANVLDEIEIAAGPILPLLRSKTSLKLRCLGEERLPRREAVPERQRAAAWASLHDQPPASAREFELDIAKAGNHTNVASVLHDLDRLSKRDSEGGHEEERLKIALRALMRLSPSAITEAEGLVRRKHKQTSVLLRALVGSGRPAAHRVVTLVLSDRALLKPDVRSELLVSLSLCKQPTPELVGGLEALLADPQLGKQAMLGLGSVAFRLKESEPSEGRRILALLARRLETATEAREFDGAKTALRALGNAGHPDAIAIASPYLDAEQAPVRAAAVASLRRIPGDEAHRRLTRLATGDPDEQVRVAAQRALDERASRTIPGSS
jgi:hypothetical protein